jgi:hypothetical protein
LVAHAATSATNSSRRIASVARTTRR